MRRRTQAAPSSASICVDLWLIPLSAPHPTVEAALSTFSEADFDRNFDLAAMAADGTVYPDIWDEPLEDLRAEYLAYLGQLKAHVGRAARAGHALLIALR